MKQVRATFPNMTRDEAVKILKARSQGRWRR